MLSYVNLPQQLTTCFLVFMLSYCLPGIAQAKNPLVSSWETNLSQDEEDSETYEDYDQEIIVEGDTVHVMWITTLTDGSKAVNYRRSLNGGKDFGAVVRVATFTSDQGLLTSNTYRRMAVANGNVLIFHSYYGQGSTWYGILGVSRSQDNGATFGDVEVLHNAGDVNHVYDLHAISDQGRVGVCYRVQVNWNENNTGYVRMTDDGGATWESHSVYSFSDTSLGWSIGDALLYGDDVHVLYRGTYYSYGLQEGVLYLATSHNGGGSFTSQQISVPSLNGKHKTYSLQEENYVPKISAHADNVAVVWAGLDSTDVLTIFAILSQDNGDTFSSAIPLNQEGDTAVEVQAGQETLALSGQHLYIIYQATNGAVHFRRGSPSGVVAGDTILTVTSGTYYGDEGWWAGVQTNPEDTTGASATVLSDWPQIVQTVDGGQNFTNPALVSPRFSYSGSLTSGARRPRFTFDSQGRLHYVVEARYYSTLVCGGYCDFDIIYRRVEPASSPGSGPANFALHMENDTDTEYFGNMHVPAGASNTVTTALTLEAWVRPYDGGRTTGSTSAERPIVYKRASSYAMVYALMTTNTNAGRVFGARLKTDEGEWVLTPDSSDAGVVKIGQWSHLALVYDAAASGDNLMLYLNGELLASTHASGTVEQGDGCFFTGYYGTHDVDELRLWNTARSASQIEATRLQHLTGNETGLLAYYPFDGKTTQNATWTGADNRVGAGDGVLMYKETYVTGAPLNPDAGSIVASLISILLD
ncbi:sialidase family protein [Desulfovibrio inopinatus]|uniref:sialidase family protein n=1 Tax=Desulfovibrio inopinatus TaxID=102109 RepID=UPI0004016C9C|nr:sialidase family protein [Desulfovibrio inopinatus]